MTTTKAAERVSANESEAEDSGAGSNGWRQTLDEVWARCGPKTRTEELMFSVGGVVSLMAIAGCELAERLKRNRTDK